MSSFDRTSVLFCPPFAAFNSGCIWQCFSENKKYLENLVNQKIGLRCIPCEEKDAAYYTEKIWAFGNDDMHLRTKAECDELMELSIIWKRLEVLQEMYETDWRDMFLPTYNNYLRN